MKRERFGAACRYALLVLLLAALLPGAKTWTPWALFAFVLFLSPVSLLLSLPAAKHISASLSLPTSAAKEKSASGVLILTNNSLFPAVKLRITISILNDLTGEEETLSLSAGVGAKQTFRQELELKSAHCGRLYVHIKSAAVFDYFGVFSKKLRLEAAARLTVLPELFPCDVSISPAFVTADEESVSERGDDMTELFALREYQSGDPIRRIHWKLSSKVGSLLVKEPGRNISRSLLVFWDKRHGCSPMRMDALAEAACSLAQSLSEQGLSYDLAWSDGEELQLRSIPDGNALLAAIGAMVTRAGHPDSPLPDTKGYGRVIRFCAALPDTVDEENIFHILCCDAQAASGKNMLVFSPENRKEQLERLEI
ncbi:MAG: DUF58 domain-containing protein [Clostridia bacterium]|nr:DUF58 domain-containing protein [Clostridia bacterium]